MKFKLRIIYFIIFISNFGFSWETKKSIIEPGVVFYHSVNKNTPLSIYILELDLTIKNNRIQTGKADSKILNRKKTSEIAKQLQAKGKNVIAAINADFFAANGTPVGAQVQEGVLLQKPYSRSVFGITDLGLPFIDIVKFSGSIISKKGVSCSIDAINRNRKDNQLVMLNKYNGISSNANYWGSEIIAKYVTKPVVNDTFKIVIIAKDSIQTEEHGNNIIPQNGIVLSAHGDKSEFINRNLFFGDTVKVILNLPPVKGKIQELIGGVPRIVRDGKISIENKKETINDKFCTDKHPRTGIGFTREKDKIMLFVVDGRQDGYSIGMSLHKFAEFMIKWNVYQGLNLDGGGSSTMFIKDKVVNKPSDIEGERPVSNAILILSNDIEN